MEWARTSHLTADPIHATQVHADERVGLSFYQLGYLWPNMGFDFPVFGGAFQVSSLNARLHECGI
jgi:hypothetical protein